MRRCSYPKRRRGRNAGDFGRSSTKLLEGKQSGTPQARFFFLRMTAGLGGGDGVQESESSQVRAPDLASKFVTQSRKENGAPTQNLALPRRTASLQERVYKKRMHECQMLLPLSTARGEERITGIMSLQWAAMLGGFAGVLRC